MKARIMIRKHGFTVLMIGSLMTLPGCAVFDWIKDKFGGVQPVTGTQESVSVPVRENVAPSMAVEDGSEVLVFLDGKPLITRNKVEEAKVDMLEMNPRLKQMVGLMDQKQLDLNIIQGLISQAVVDRYITNKGIDARADYRQELDRAVRSIKQMLNTKFFTQDFPVNVSQAEIRAFYDKNKEIIPDLLISHGGTRAACVSFDKEDDARAFAKKVTDYKDDIKKAVQEAGLADRFKDFRLINAQSTGIEPSLREKILAMQKVPGTEVCALDNGTYYVVTATGKEEAKYQPFEQVEAGIKEYLEREKRVQVYEQEINKLVNEYKITKSKSIEAAMEEMKKQFESAAESAPAA